MMDICVSASATGNVSPQFAWKFTSAKGINSRLVWQVRREFPRASERRVLPIVGVCISSSHLHIFSSSHLLIFTSSHLHIFSSSHLLIFTSSHLHIFSLHIFSSSHFLIFTSSHLLIFTSSHLHIFSSSHLLITFSHLHIFTSLHPHTFTSSPFALLPLALLPSPSFLFLF